VSVAVGVAAVDGLALAADSRTIQQRAGHPEHYRVLSDSAEKLFVLDNRFVAATYGMAMIGDKTIRGHMEDFAVETPADLVECANSLGAFFHARLSEVTPPRRGDLAIYDIGFPLGFLVGGYDGAGVGRFIDVKVRATAQPDVKESGISTENPGHAPRGQVDAIERMLHGVDWTAIEVGRIPVDDSLKSRLENLHYDILIPTTVDDAAGFAGFLVQTQIGMQARHDGTMAKPKEVPGAGGAVRVAAITRGGAEWIQNQGRPLAKATARRLPLGRAGEAP
jgi:hypothetical protein